MNEGFCCQKLTISQYQYCCKRLFNQITHVMCNKAIEMYTCTCQCCMCNNNNNNNNKNNRNNMQVLIKCILISQTSQWASYYYYGVRKIVTVILLHLRVQLAKCTSYQHLECNISHNRHLPDVLRSRKQLRLSTLPKDTNMLALAGLELTV